MISHDTIRQLDDDHDCVCTTYTSSNNSLDLDYVAHQECLNRLSNTSTLVSPSLYASQSTLSDIKTAPAKPNAALKKRKQHSVAASASKKGLLYRFMHSESGRLVCAVVYFVVVCIGMAFCNQLSDNRWVETEYTHVFLRDRGFDVIEAMADIQPANTFVMTSIVFSVIGIGMICPSWTMRAIVLRRMLWVIGTLSAFRALTLSVTTLPTPKEECRPTLKTGFWDMFMVSLQMIPGTVEACTDDIFSGHTVFMVSCAIQWRLYCKNKWVTYFSYLYISFGLYFVVATRLHYTVDVVLAVFITFATWSLYIGMIDIVMEHEYFGIQSHHEKYAAFDAITDDYEFTQVVGDEESDTRYIRGGPGAGVAPSGSYDLHARRRQLEHYMNRLRGPRIGYELGEHDRVAFLPMQFNLWLKCLIRWCDGLDLRMRPVEFERSADNLSRWEEYVLRYRSEQVSASVRSGTHSTLKHRKMNEGFEEEDDGVEQVYYREGLRFESTRVHDYSNDALERQQQQGRWRSVPTRSATSHSSRSATKDKNPKWTDNNTKLRILKIALIVFVNAILLAKVVQVIHNRAEAAQSSHWPQDMESYPGGTIYKNDSEPPVLATPDSQLQREHSNFEGPDHSHDAEEDVQIEQEEEESEYRREHERRHYRHHRHQGEHRHHRAEREWIPEGAI